MRQLLRSLTMSALVAIVALSGTAAVASAAAPNSNGNGTSYEMYEDWCFDDITVLFCFEVHGRWTIVDQNNGDQIGTAAVRTRAWVVENGRVVAASLDHTTFQTKFVDGYAEKEFLISQTRTLVPGEQCVAHLQLRFEDGVIVVDRTTLSCH
jgi:hypothetical protein